MRVAHGVFAGLLSVALPCALAAQFARGAGYTTTITIDSGGVKHVSSTQMEVLGAKFRMAMNSDAVAATPFEFFQIWDSTAATVTQVMPTGSVAMIMPLSVISSSPMMKQPVSIETEPGVKSEIVDLGAGEKILGYATRHYHQTIAYTVKYTIGGETCSNRRNDVAEIWTTELTMQDRLRKSLCGR